MKEIDIEKNDMPLHCRGVLERLISNELDNFIWSKFSIIGKNDDTTIDFDVKNVIQE